MAAALAAAAAVLGGGLLAPASIPLLSLGYVLGGIVSIVFSSVYRALRNGLRPHPRFRPQPALDRLLPIGVVLGILAGLSNAVLLATELAK